MLNDDDSCGSVRPALNNSSASFTRARHCNTETQSGKINTCSWRHRIPSSLGQPYFIADITSEMNSERFDSLQFGFYAHFIKVIFFIIVHYNNKICVNF